MKLWIHCCDIPRMCFTIAISVRHIIAMTEPIDFINSSLAFTTHGLDCPVFDFYIIWLQIRYADCIIGMGFRNVPIFTLVGCVGSGCYYQQTSLLKLFPEPMFALHNTLGIIKPFDVTSRTNHRIVPVGKLGFSSECFGMAFRAERYQIADGICTASFSWSYVMYLETSFCFTTFHALAAVAADSCQPKIIVQPVRLLILPTVRLVSVCQCPNVDFDIFKPVPVNTNPLAKSVNHSKCSLLSLNYRRHQPATSS